MKHTLLLITISMLFLSSCSKEKGEANLKTNIEVSPFIENKLGTSSLSADIALYSGSHDFSDYTHYLKTAPIGPTFIETKKTYISKDINPGKYTLVVNMPLSDDVTGGTLMLKVIDLKQGDRITLNPLFLDTDPPLKKVEWREKQ